ncbi:MAG TPA: ArsR family transcriptional regulator [Gemmatimonadaceae bacterium]|jgi:predicted ArsR family transcriptional regulator|nr:ArsR family transcriptional regulator [Gemmatimonadaceae bacterium]
MTDTNRRPAAGRSDGTRPRILALLREGSWTVDDLAARLELTDNAVRFHLDALEREGTVRKEGRRRTGAVGQPAALYSLSTEAEEAFSRAYAPVLIATLAELKDQMSRSQLVAFLKRVGRRLSGEGEPPTGPLSGRVRSASRLLDSLGGVTTVEQTGDVYRIIGRACPLSSAVEADHCVCAAVTSLVAEVVGAEVTERCDRSGHPKCCFEITSDARTRTTAHG